MSNKIDNRVIVALGFVAVLALIAKPVWDAREQWQFGESRDDAVYLVGAKSIASGTGYRQEDLPGRPYLTKYPPLFPLLMSIAWRITPDFPRTLQTASILQACLLPVYLALLLAVLRQLGFSWRRTFLVAAMTYVSFRFVLLAVTLFSELLFGCFLLAAVFLIERSAESNSFKCALLGGALAGLAYLTRSAALPIFAAAPIFLLIRKRPRLIASFLAAALPIAVGWHLWIAAHSAGALHTPYLDEYLQVIGQKGLGEHLAQQAGTLSASVAEVLSPGFLGLIRGLPLYHLVLAAAIAGGIRMGRKRRWPLLLVFTGLYLVMIVCWWFQGLGRLMVPVWPVMLAGIAEEASHFASLLAQHIKHERFKTAPRWALIAAAVCIVIRNDEVTWRKTASIYDRERGQRARDKQAYEWISKHGGQGSIVLAWKEALAYLYTGVPSSHDLFVAKIPTAEDERGLRPVFSLPKGQFQDAILLLLVSDLQTGPDADLDADFSQMDSFRAQAESQAGSRLEYSAPGAYVYRIPLP